MEDAVKMTSQAIYVADRDYKVTFKGKTYNVKIYLTEHDTNIYEIKPEPKNDDLREELVNFVLNEI